MTLSTQVLYEEIIGILYNNTAPMSVNDIRDALTYCEEPKGLLSRLVQAEYGYSPVARLKHDCYDLTAWARDEMRAGKVPLNPLDSKYARKAVSFYPGKCEELTDILVKVLMSGTEAILTSPSPLSIIQVAAVSYPHLRECSLPQDLLAFLNTAYAQVDSNSSGAIFCWLYTNTKPEKPGADPMHLKYKRTIQLSKTTRLRKFKHGLEAKHGPVVQLVESIDAVAQMVQASMRYYLGAPGETITSKQVYAIYGECKAGQSGNIYSLGRISSQAEQTAARLGIGLKQTYITLGIMQ